MRRFFILLRSVKPIYLTVYFLFLIKAGSFSIRSYWLAVFISSILGFFVALYVFVYLVFGFVNDEIDFSVEGLLSHGLSYEEWRTSDQVKQRMETAKGITKTNHQELPEEAYLISLLLLSFTGFVEYRAKTSEEMLSDLCKDYFEGDDSSPCEVFEVGDGEIKQGESVDCQILKEDLRDSLDEIGRHKSLSWLMYCGVDMVFLRKKIGPKKPKHSECLYGRLGIKTN